MRRLLDWFLHWIDFVCFKTIWKKSTSIYLIYVYYYRITHSWCLLLLSNQDHNETWHVKDTVQSMVLVGVSAVWNNVRRGLSELTRNLIDRWVETSCSDWFDAGGPKLPAFQRFKYLWPLINVRFVIKVMHY